MTGRFLSKESAHWAAEVMAGYGFRPYVINRSSPTPLMMFMVKTRAMPYGIAVMASHNPAIYNGIKVFTAGGRDADRTVTDKIESEIAQINPDTIKSMDYDAAVAAGVITEHNPTNEYIDSILSAIDVEAIKNAQLRIALDPMYGVSQTSLGMIFMTCRCDLEIIHDRHDTIFGGASFPRRTRTRSARKLALQQYLFEQHAARNLKTSITSAVRTAARSISRTAAGSSVASPAPSRSCAWLPRLRQTKKPSPISRPGKPSCRSERSA